MATTARITATKRKATTLDTTTPTVPAAGDATPAEGGPTDEGRGSSGRFWWWVAGVAAAALVLGLAVNLIELDKVTIGPGGARPVTGLIEVGEGGEAFTSDGEILFTTVALDDQVSVWEAFMGWLDADTAVFDESDILGDRSEDESRQFNQELMDDSKTAATAVALGHLGCDVVTGSGALVAGVGEDQPADGVLEDGDTIVAIDGEPIELGDELVASVRGREPGETARLTVEDQEGETREEVIELGARPDDADAAFLGIGVATRDLDFDLPYDIEIDSGRVGGPSAGLAFTLALLDVLTPGELTGGTEVATTGTINGLGEVGRVGGVAQKAAAVRGTDATLFLVPEAEEADAREAAGDAFEVVAVADLDEALTALAENGGNALDLEPIDPDLC